jgi:hypothetical protein
MGDRSSTIWKNTRGDEIDDTRVVFLNWVMDASGERGEYKLGDEDAEEYASVYKARACDEHSNCRLIFVRLMSTGIPESDAVHADNDTQYTVAWRK